MLRDMGFTEIDVSFPSASDTEFNFTRKLVETPGVVPDDMWLQVLSPCRKELIRRTVDSVTGAKKAIISLYIASSENFVSTIFGMTQKEVLEMAVDCVRYTKSITKDDPAQQGTTWNLMFSPEAFSDTDSSYAIELCNAVREAWEGTPEVPIILNLPATVEMSTPNTFADQVEIFCRAFPQDSVIVSLHPHNDRGCAVAAAEQGQLAGAKRVEGCLFGNGERTGNVDLVTLALNLYTQGVDPGLDFSDLPGIRRTVEKLTRIPVHTRAPYAGDSVFLAYSGSHQDAINKGFKMWENPCADQENVWKVPYLPLDPKDIGATYEAIVKVNSQSGKGGVAWTLQRSVNLDLPKGMQQDFSKLVKAESDRVGEVLSPIDIQEFFLKTYQVLGRDPRILKYTIDTAPSGRIDISTTILVNGLARRVHGKGDTVPAAISAALAMGTGLQMSLEVFEREWVEGGRTQPMAIAMCDLKRAKLVSWGANMCADMREAELLACLAAVLPLRVAPDRPFRSDG
ncbi:HMGL-like-domain-containing protein [Delitschia confertaspora ATCC 74209]|uniref:2-isopropylmalate synthase n=1 Tax=Delitschia confertaspora ATCC 74209 TaxID=1513339 RepID=A0A9P4JF10_9PLEO|nr:HMGL-like-domain-containing protein [Delitschia confertaspora ATCC 74209]